MAYTFLTKSCQVVELTKELRKLIIENLKNEKYTYLL